jgi:cytochrome c peroxidase
MATNAFIGLPGPSLGCSCHDTRLATRRASFYGTDALPRAIGVKQRPHPRNAPTVLNTGVLQIVHWRGDRESLEDQVAKAVTSPITSGQPDEKAIIDRLSRVTGYAPAVYGGIPERPTTNDGTEYRQGDQRL